MLGLVACQLRKVEPAQIFIKMVLRVKIHHLEVASRQLVEEEAPIRDMPILATHHFLTMEDLEEEGALHCTDQSADCRSGNGNVNILQDNGTTTHSSQGFNGGTCPAVTSSTSSIACGSVTAGGGGDGGVGGSIATTGISTSANGGIGKNYSSNFSNLYGASGWFSGGGGGSNLSLGAQSGLANTGGGGGGHDVSVSPCQIGGGNGGSGIVIVRYTR
jgi:hypothetical protein